MKKTLLLFIFLSALHCAKASDTLTIRQVYNFNVGDTFDYSYTLSFYGASFRRVVIASRQFSPDSTSVTYVRTQLYPVNYVTDTVTYHHLDSFIIPLGSSSPYTFHSDTMGGHITNTVRGGSLGFDPVVDVTYTEGLGVVNIYTGSYFYGCNNADYSFGSYYSTLVYYSGAYKYGRPYYTMNGQSLIRYIPIPEDCTYWNYAQITANGTDHFQLHTGNKTYLNDHTYVELILRSIVNNVFSSDSLVGYFRNDTSGQRVYYCHQPGINEFPIYEFSGTDQGGSNGTYYSGTMLDTFTTANIQRTIWKTTTLEPLGDGCVWQYISGIGTRSGLFHSQACDAFTTCHTLPPPPPELKSFCVCGQVQYPANATGQCSLLTGINENLERQTTIYLYPNPTSDHLHLSFPGAQLCSAHLTLTDLLGQTVYSSAITDPETTHDISSLPSGIYTWRIVSDNTILKTGKLVKQ